MSAGKWFFVLLGAAVLIAAVVAGRSIGNRQVKTVVSADKFQRTLEHYSILEELALEGMKRKEDASEESYLAELKEKALTNWADCVNLMDESKEIAISENMEKKRLALKEYGEQRVQETLLYIRALENKTDQYNRQIDSLHEVLATSRKNLLATGR